MSAPSAIAWYVKVLVPALFAIKIMSLLIVRKFAVLFALKPTHYVFNVKMEQLVRLAPQATKLEPIKNV
jgi:hypothetical protein